MALNHITDTVYVHSILLCCVVAVFCRLLGASGDKDLSVELFHLIRLASSDVPIHNIASVQNTSGTNQPGM